MEIVFVIITALFGVHDLGCTKQNSFHLGENEVEFNKVKQNQARLQPLLFLSDVTLCAMEVTSKHSGCEHCTGYTHYTANTEQGPSNHRATQKIVL